MLDFRRPFFYFLLSIIIIAIKVKKSISQNNKNEKFFKKIQTARKMRSDYVYELFDYVLAAVPVGFPVGLVVQLIYADALAGGNVDEFSVSEIKSAV